MPDAEGSTIMRRLGHLLLTAIVGVLLTPPASAQQAGTIRIATWNMAWLTDRMPGTGGEGGVPDNVHHRTKADWALVKKYAKRLNADIVAFEEVDGIAMAKKAYGASKYNFHTTTEPDVQKPGFALRKGISFTRNPDFADLDVIADQPRSLRRGADITVQLAGQKIRMLAVHLKSGCPAQSLDNTSGDACPLLKQQLPILARWINERIDEKVPFIILGDFNRIFEDNEAFWRGMNLNGEAGLIRSTAGRTSACWAGKHPKFIDHIVFGGGARQWAESSSFKVMVYDETDPKFQDRISDHCPQYMTMKVKKP
jgi:endonuclease/exonuclease/phosphatase family metal-dependent hydrolase